MESSAVSCFPRGLISLNTSVSYLIEPLSADGDAQQHAVFRAESLHLPGGSCLHHHGNKEHEEGLNDFIRGMMSPQSRRVSSDRTDKDHLPEILCRFFHIAIVSPHNSVKTFLHFQEKRDLSQNMKYVELLLVADKAEVRTQLLMCCHIWSFLNQSGVVKCGSAGCENRMQSRIRNHVNKETASFVTVCYELVQRHAG